MVAILTRPAVTLPVATRRLRTDRMHHHIPGWTEATRAGLEAALRAAHDGPKHWVVPDRAAVWMVDPKEDPRRRARGPQRMREHTRSLLINALRSDGTLESTIQVQTCKAFRILPWDIGLRAQDSAAEVPKPTTHADVAAAYVEHVASPIADYIAKGLLTPEQVRFAYGTDLPETDSERELRMRLTNRDSHYDPSSAACRWPALFDPGQPSIVDLFYDPGLLAVTNEPWPRPGWLKFLIRRITRRNGGVPR